MTTLQLVQSPSAEFDRALAEFEDWVRSLRREDVPAYELRERAAGMKWYVQAILTKFEVQPEQFFSLRGIRTNCSEWPEQVPLLLQLLTQHAEKLHRQASQSEEWRGRAFALRRALARFDVPPLPQKKQATARAADQIDVPHQPRFGTRWTAFVQEQIASNTGGSLRSNGQARNESGQLRAVRALFTLHADLEREEFRSIIAMKPNTAAEKFHDFLLYAIRFPELHSEVVRMVTSWVGELLAENPRSAAWTRAVAWSKSCIFRHGSGPSRSAEIGFGHKLNAALEPLKPEVSKARSERLRERRNERMRR